MLVIEHGTGMEHSSIFHIQYVAVYFLTIVLLNVNISAMTSLSRSS